VLFMNYNFTGKIGSPVNFVTSQFVQSNLTGIALVPRFGGDGVPLPPAVWSASALIASLGMIQFARKRVRPATR
jgi:hypothetical protein